MNNFSRFYIVVVFLLLPAYVWAKNNSVSSNRPILKPINHSAMVDYDNQIDASMRLFYIGYGQNPKMRYDARNGVFFLVDSPDLNFPAAPVFKTKVFGRGAGPLLRLNSADLPGADLKKSRDFFAWLDANGWSFTHQASAKIPDHETSFFRSAAAKLNNYNGTWVVVGDNGYAYHFVFRFPVRFKISDIFNGLESAGFESTVAALNEHKKPLIEDSSVNKNEERSAIAGDMAEAKAPERITYEHQGKIFEVLTEKKFKYGNLKIVEYVDGNGNREHDVLFGSESIFPQKQLENGEKYSDYGYLFIDSYEFSDEEVVLIHRFYGGAVEVGDYFFLTLSENSPPLTSKLFGSGISVDEEKVIKSDDEIVVDLGYNDNGDTERAVYKNRNVQIVQLKNSKITADEENCTYLYDYIYKPYAQSQECEEEPSMVGGMSTSRAYISLNDPNINYDTFEQLSKSACKVGGINLLIYDDFRKMVCVRK